MVCNIVIIRFSDTVLIGIREEFHLLFLHFTSKRIRIFLWLRGEHDCFFQIKQHTKTLIRISHPSKHFITAFPIPVHEPEDIFHKFQRGNILIHPVFVLLPCPFNRCTVLFRAHNQRKPLLIGVQNRKDILDSFKKPNARHIKFHNAIFYAHCRFIQHGKLGARRKFIAIELFVLQFSFMFFPYLCKFTNQGDFPNAQFLRPAFFFHSISSSYIDIKRSSSSR